MEFPTCGGQCSVKGCRQLDFLPIICNYCSYTFCRDHFLVTSHFCSKPDNLASGTKILNSFSCSQEYCINKSVVQMSCTTCKKHFCIVHRHHGCSEQNQTQKSIDLEKYLKRGKDIMELEKAIDVEIEENLKKSKNSIMARKVQLMKLKGKSVGPKNVPISERCFFLVHVPLNRSLTVTERSKCAFVSSHWNIGKVIDSLADSLDIPNCNSIANEKKLRIFNYSTGNIITNEMDIKLCELLNKNFLASGEDIILEYSNDNKIDQLLY